MVITSLGVGRAEVDLLTNTEPEKKQKIIIAGLKRVE